ncbi:cytochrome P450 [Whalleya microplaca]|nr:cytochrome P450 [Whalleya microplaca]
MALHVLGRCGFDKEGTCLEELRFSEKPPNDHKLSFADTFLGIDQDLPLIALTPPFLLNNSPLQVHKRGKVLRSEMQGYLDEAINREHVSANQKEATSKSLLNLLVDASDNGLLSKEQVAGNIFILYFAGHESNAHALQFALLNLACQPEMQKKVQHDIDRILDNLPSEKWSYAEHFTALSQSMVGAVINESLRVYTVLPVLMKQTTETSVTVSIDDRHHVIPTKTLIVINTSATHRNPSYWSTPTVSAREGEPYAVSSFNPEQWFNQDGKFFVPEPGSYIPFSDGPRGCIGQRFAVVELCASLAMILKHQNIELAVNNDNENETAEDRRRRWETARDDAIHQLSGGIAFNMTLRLGDKVPVRFTKRA